MEPRNASLPLRIVSLRLVLTTSICSLPIAILFSLSLVLSNWAYLYCSVAFIHILKSISPVAILLAAFAFRTKHFSLKLCLIVLTISAGGVSDSRSE